MVCRLISDLILQLTSEQHGFELCGGHLEASVQLHGAGQLVPNPLSVQR